MIAVAGGEVVLRALTNQERYACRQDETTHEDRSYREIDIEKRLALYPDEERREWLRRRLEAWWDTRSG